MKLTKPQLTVLIREELIRVLKEGPWARKKKAPEKESGIPLRLPLPKPRYEDPSEEDEEDEEEESPCAPSLKRQKRGSTEIGPNIPRGNIDFTLENKLTKEQLMNYIREEMKEVLSEISPYDAPPAGGIDHRPKRQKTPIQIINTLIKNIEASGRTSSYSKEEVAQLLQHIISLIAGE